MNHPRLRLRPALRRAASPAGLLTLAAVGAVGLAVSPLAAQKLDVRRLALRSEAGGVSHVHAFTPVRLEQQKVAQRRAALEAWARHRAPRAKDVSDTGSWSSSMPSPVKSIHAVMLPTGKVLFFGNDLSVGADHSADVFTWQPPAQGRPGGGTWNRVSPPIDPDTGRPANIFCAGMSFLPDGRLVVAGGNKRFPVGDQEDAHGNTYEGLEWILIFDPFTETWSRQPDMHHGRWYPSLVTLSDGRVVIMSGFTETGYGDMNTDVEVFTPPVAPGGQGTVAVMPTAARRTEFYPHLFVLPGDRVVLGGQNSGDSAILDTTTWRWTELPRIPVERLWSTGYLEPYDATTGPRYVTVNGGYDSGHAVNSDGRIFRLDLTDTAAGWREQPSLGTPRAHHNTQLLADGSAVTIGGGNGIDLRPGGAKLYAGPVYTTEIRNPDGTWRTVPGQAERRTYHSTTVLLPDGRVVSAGDDYTGVRRPVEIYSPPYLFRGARPVIARAPQAVTYGERFLVTTPDAGSVTRAVLMAPTSTTHSTDMGQREIVLPMESAGAGQLRLTAPTGVGFAPRGYYMLTLVNARGVPSVSSWVRLTDQPTADVPPLGGDPAPAPATTPPAGPATPATAPAAADAPATPPAAGGGVSPVTVTGPGPFTPPTSGAVPSGGLLAGTRATRVGGKLVVVARAHGAGLLRVWWQAGGGVRTLAQRRVRSVTTVRVVVPRRARPGDHLVVRLNTTRTRSVQVVLSPPVRRPARSR